jgi:hypothetical protein
MYDSTLEYRDKTIFNLISENNGSHDYSFLSLGSGNSTHNITMDGNLSEISVTKILPSTQNYIVFGGTNGKTTTKSVYDTKNGVLDLYKTNDSPNPSIRMDGTTGSVNLYNGGTNPTITLDGKNSLINFTNDLGYNTIRMDGGKGSVNFLDSFVKINNDGLGNNYLRFYSDKGNIVMYQNDSTASTDTPLLEISGSIGCGFINLYNGGLTPTMKFNGAVGTIYTNYIRPLSLDNDFVIGDQSEKGQYIIKWTPSVGVMQFYSIGNSSTVETIDIYTSVNGNVNNNEGGAIYLKNQSRNTIDLDGSLGRIILYDGVNTDVSTIGLRGADGTTYFLNGAIEMDFDNVTPYQVIKAGYLTLIDGLAKEMVRINGTSGGIIDLYNNNNPNSSTINLNGVNGIGSFQTITTINTSQTYNGLITITGAKTQADLVVGSRYFIDLLTDSSGSNPLKLNIGSYCYSGLPITQLIANANCLSLTALNTMYLFLCITDVGDTFSTSWTTTSTIPSGIISACSVSLTPNSTSTPAGPIPLFADYIFSPLPITYPIITLKGNKYLRLILYTQPVSEIIFNRINSITCYKVNVSETITTTGPFNLTYL